MRGICGGRSRVQNIEVGTGARMEVGVEGTSQVVVHQIIQGERAGHGRQMMQVHARSRRNGWRARSGWEKNEARRGEARAGRTATDVRVRLG
jgi:hypothetical protein